MFQGLKLKNELTNVKTSKNRQPGDEITIWLLLLLGIFFGTDVMAGMMIKNRGPFVFRFRVIKFIIKLDK